MEEFVHEFFVARKAAGLSPCNRALFGKMAKRNAVLRIAGDTPVQKRKQGWSAVRRWKRNAVKAMYIARST